jgi:hypothetical protein
MTKRFTFWLTVLILLAPTGLAMACPACKDSIPNSVSESAAGVPSGINWSVYYMLGGFMGTLGLVVGVIVKGVNETKR